jgi:hypothetical protein
MIIMDETRAERDNTPGHHCDSQDVFGAESFDSHRPEDFEEDVGWVEACRDDVELVAFETQTFFEAKDFGVASGGFVSIDACNAVGRLEELQIAAVEVCKQ